MDNYDLSNLPLSGQCAHSGENYPWLTDEENRLATFSRRSVTVSTSEQTELQRYPSTGDEQIPEQTVLADFGISFAPNVFEPLIVDDPEDPFAALAAYQSPTAEDDPRHPFDSELDFFEGFSAESLPDVVLAEPEGNDFLELSVRSEHPQQLEPTEQPEQSQDGLYARGISIPESANPDTVSGKRRAPQRRNVVIGDVPESAIKKSQYRSKRRTKKRQKLDSTEIKIVPLPQGVVSRGRSVTKPARSAISELDTDQNPNETLKERIKRKTEKWVVISKDKHGQNHYQCSYPDCGYATSTFTLLKRHIFCHIHISKYQCTYPACSANPYFRDSVQLQRHIQSQHKYEKLYHCTLCGKRFRRSDNCKRHMRNVHKMSP